MTSISFQPRFVPLIRAGTKRQTIRSPRKRPIEAGETLHLFTGMRTSACSLIGVATCSSVEPIRLTEGDVETPSLGRFYAPAVLNEFARADGFADWAELRGFFTEPEFEGVVIRWGDLRDE